MSRPTRVALALGGGGARGYAHVGVLQVLEERGYDVVSIAGSSMGALVGGLYAAGSLDAYTDWVSTLTQRDVLLLLDPSLKAPGAIRGEKVLAKVADLLGDVAIEDLPIPYTAVATDLLAGREVWFQHGPLHAAIRASIALPSFITPVVLHGRLLADGGLLNPVPVAATAAASADISIAVSFGQLHGNSAGAAPVQEAADPDLADDRSDRSRLSIAQVFDGDLAQAIASWFTGVREASIDTAVERVEVEGAEPGGAGDEDPGDVGAAEELEEQLFGALPPGLRTLDVMQLSLEALQSVVTRFRLAAYPPDILITVPRTSCRTLDFHRAKEMIAIGRDQAIEALDREAP
jgi:NTE family protein